MSIATNKTAFIADQLDELIVFPLLDEDCSVTLSPSAAGLQLTANSLQDNDDDSFVMTYDGAQWRDGGLETDRDEPSASALWPPLIPDDMTDVDLGDEDALANQFDATVEAHATLVELVTTLVASGWHLDLRHVVAVGATPRINVHADAPHIDAERAATASRTLRLPADLSRLEATYVSQSGGDGQASWGFSDGQVIAVTHGGERRPVRIGDVLTLALCSAPAWALVPGLDAPVERHTAGSPMRASFLTQPPPAPAPTQEEIDERRNAVDTWAANNDFGPLIEPAMPAAVRKELTRLGSGSVGYYLLEFANGDCYLGQSISIADRLTGHRAVHKDILGIRLRPDMAAENLRNPLRHLLDHEATLIHGIQQAGLPARNKAQMTYLASENRPVDELFEQHGTTASSWLADPIAANDRAGQAGRALHATKEQLAAGEAAYSLWLKRTGDNAAAVRSLLRTYLHRCVPLPVHTEYVLWVLSSPQTIPAHRTLSNLSIGWTEAFRTMIGKDGHLSGMLHVNGVELLGEEMADDALVRFMRQHPGVHVTESNYQAAGPFNLMLWAPDLSSVADLLDDTAVTRAAATAALHLMRKGGVGNIKNSHNPILVDEVLGLRH